MSDLQNRVVSLQKKGKSKEDIYVELLSEGRKVKEIEVGFFVSEKTKEVTQRRAIQIIVISGALFIGAGIFSFIAANWQGMAKVSKILVILISMFTSYSTGAYLSQEKKLYRTGEAFIFLGTIIYGAGIFLVAQMYNIRTDWADGFMLWMFGALAVAFATKSKLILLFSVILGFVSVFGYPFVILGNRSHDPFLMTSTLLLIVATIVSFVVSMNMRSKKNIS